MGHAQMDAPRLSLVLFANGWQQITDYPSCYSEIWKRPLGCMRREKIGRRSACHQGQGRTTAGWTRTAGHPHPPRACPHPGRHNPSVRK
jgi:hypothetical protein